MSRALRLALLALAALCLPAAAHDGHEHAPVGRWFFWPDYSLPGKAHNQPGTRPPPPRTAYDVIDLESPPLLFLGERPTDRVGRLLPPERLPTQAFSVEVWLVDHVNQPVSAYVTARGPTGATPPAWLLGYGDGRALFTLRAGADPEPARIDVAVTNAFKKYWRHLVATYDGDAVRLYLNGEPVGEAKAAGTVALPPDAELEVAACLGREPHMELGNLIRDVRLYDDDIGPTQVRGRFAALSRQVEEGIIFEDRFHFTAGPALTWVTPDGIRVAWETDRPARAVVRYGRTLPLEHEVSLDAPDRLQQASLAGLEPETPYFYEVTAFAADGGEARSGTLTFKTAVRAESPFSFAILGDTEARPHINNVIAKAIWAERPDFVLHVGDLTDGGQRDHKFEWPFEYFLGMNQLIGRVPVFPVPGNGESDLHWYLRYHPLPSPGGRYTFRYGNAEFFLLDSNRPMGPGSEQFAWLEQALAASAARWKIAAHHHPTYTSDEDDYGDSYRGPSKLGDPDVRSVVPLYEKYRVDLVFFGHLHSYERTWPIADGRVNLEKGVRYVQTGGAGGNLEDATPTRNWFSTKLHRGHHYCMVRVFEGRLVFQMFDTEGRLRDSFELNK